VWDYRATVRYDRTGPCHFFIFDESLSVLPLPVVDAPSAELTREDRHGMRPNDHADRVALLVLGADEEGARHHLHIGETLILELLGKLLRERLRLRALVRSRAGGRTRLGALVLRERGSLHESDSHNRGCEQLDKHH
jgi:hypothetical protein